MGGTEQAGHRGDMTVGTVREYSPGNLRSALVEAGLRLARHGGTQALGLRAVTRDVGVTPNAAYRHFADHRDLMLAVAAEAQSRLAQAMLDMPDATGPEAGPGARAVARLRKVGLGYIQFALTEPGWTEVALLSREKPHEPGERTAPPFRLLVDALDEMVSAGVITPERRTDAEWFCWSGVHGFTDLATRGPLQWQDRAVLDRLAAHVVETIINALTA